MVVAHVAWAKPKKLVASFYVSETKLFRGVMVFGLWFLLGLHSRSLHSRGRFFLWVFFVGFLEARPKGFCARDEQTRDSRVQAQEHADAGILSRMFCI